MAAISFFAGLMGLAVGSFLNVVIARAPAGETVWRGRSHCPHCRKTLTAWELIPLVSFIALRGKCRNCHRRISWQYPLVEAVTAGLFIVAVNISLTWGQAVFAAFVIAVAVVVFTIDLQRELILDSVMLPALALAAAGNLLLHQPAVSWLAGALLGGGFFFLQYALSHGRWVGGGDIRMGMFLGLVLGIERTLVALVLAYAAGAVFAVSLILARRKRLGSVLPFGTFLAGAMLVCLFWGGPMLQWYMNGGLTNVLGVNALIEHFVGSPAIFQP